MAATCEGDSDLEDQIQKAIALSRSDNQIPNICPEGWVPLGNTYPSYSSTSHSAEDTENAEQLMEVIATVEQQGILLKQIEAKKPEKSKPINYKLANSMQEESNIKDNVVELSGLPWTATEEDIRVFLKDCKIKKILIILNDYSKPSGNSKVWFPSKDDLDRALLCDKNYIGKRYVYIRKANEAFGIENEREENKDRSTSSNTNPGVFTVQLRELPWTATRKQICDFLFGCEVVGGPAGVHIEMNERGKPSGSAIVHLQTKMP
jgi:RNA recognition motif-containing protein